MKVRENTIRHVGVKDGESGRTTAALELQATVKRWHAWAAFALAVLGIAGIVAGAAKVGVRQEVKEEISKQAKPPEGELYLMAHTCAEQHADETAKALRKELHTRITENADELKDEVADTKSKVISVETRQEDMVRQLERMEDRLLDAITNGGR